jgi:hypothetical protein
MRSLRLCLLRASLGASLTHPLLTTSNTFTLRSRTNRIIPLGDAAGDIRINLRFNEPRSAVPQIKGLREIRVFADPAPERGRIERSLAAESSTDLINIESARTCWCGIGHAKPHVETQGIKAQSPTDQQTLRLVGFELFSRRIQPLWFALYFDRIEPVFLHR